MQLHPRILLEVAAGSAASCLGTGLGLRAVEGVIIRLNSKPGNARMVGVIIDTKNVESSFSRSHWGTRQVTVQFVASRVYTPSRHNYIRHT